MQTKIILVAILAGLVVVLMAGILGYPKINWPAVVKQAQKAQDETAGWQTYTNEQYGFEMKYPKNWYVYPRAFFASDKDGVSFSNLSEDELKAKQEAGDFTNTHSLAIIIINGQIDDWLQMQQRWTEALKMDFFKEKITIGENLGYKISSTVEDKRGFSKVLFTKEKVYLIETLFPEKCRYEECEIFNQMLSTFKFIN